MLRKDLNRQNIDRPSAEHRASAMTSFGGPRPGRPDLKTLSLLVMVILHLLPAPEALAQALLIGQLSNGTEIIEVSQPLSDVTSLAWYELGDDGEPRPVSFSAGAMTIGAAIEDAFGGDQRPAAPAVIVVAGGAVGRDTRTLIDRLLAGQPPDSLPPVKPVSIREGGVEKRLGALGSPAFLRLEIPLPPSSTWQRTATEILFDLLPGLIGKELPGLQSRIKDEMGLLEARVDPELAELHLQRLRLAIARIASEPRIDDERVATAAHRLLTRRQAGLEVHPDAAVQVLEWWRQGGAEAVREKLFGLNGISSELTRRAAQEWLPQHPGAAVLTLPPRVFNPRFAAGPQRVQLESDLSVAVLERPATPLSVLCLRPVLLPDIDGELTATVLARLAAEVRAAENAPGWVQVRLHPARLELAAPVDSFAELCEVLQLALSRITKDDSLVDPGGGSARRRAIRLMAAQLGLGASTNLSPASLLQPDNIALGMVAADAEAAIEALRKLLILEPIGGPLQGQSLGSLQRTREAAAGRTSVLAVALTFDSPPGDITPDIISNLLLSRAATILPECRVEVLRPLVPGRTLLVLVVEAEMTLNELEMAIGESWVDWLEPPAEEKLSGIRRRVAAELSSAASGALGRARACAGFATGTMPWRSSSDVELQVLTTSPEDLAVVLESLSDWSALLTTGAGAIPITTPQLD
jgi:hypothetical protein